MCKLQMSSFTSYPLINILDVEMILENVSITLCSHPPPPPPPYAHTGLSYTQFLDFELVSDTVSPIPVALHVFLHFYSRFEINNGGTVIARTES